MDSALLLGEETDKSTMNRGPHGVFILGIGPFCGDDEVGPLSKPCVLSVRASDSEGIRKTKQRSRTSNSVRVANFELISQFLPTKIAKKLAEFNLLTFSRKRAEHCFESTVSEERTLVAHDCGYPLSRYTCRATRVAADFLDFIAFCRCSTGVALHPLKIVV